MPCAMYGSPAYSPIKSSTPLQSSATAWSPTGASQLLLRFAYACFLLLPTHRKCNMCQRSLTCPPDILSFVHCAISCIVHGARQYHVVS
eukprot:scaffold12924_cov125-Isochrysis_galbana.AAC.17